MFRVGRVGSGSKVELEESTIQGMKNSHLSPSLKLGDEGGFV